MIPNIAPSNRYDLGAQGVDADTAKLYQSNTAFGQGYTNNSNVQQVQSGVDVFKKQFKKAMGTDPTPQDISSYLRDAFHGAWNAAGDLQYTDMNAIANNYIATNYDPEKARSDAATAGAADFSGSVNDNFKSLLGREASAEEQAHFGKLLASKDIDAYQLQDFLKQQPEYTSKKDTAFREGLSGELSGYDKQYYQEQIMPAIQSAYAKQGRSFDSTGFQNAMAGAAGQQNTARQQYLAQLSASQYGGQQSNARQDYLNNYAAIQGQNAYSTQRRDALTDAAMNRAGNLADYQMQQQAYEQYLKKYGKRQKSSGMGAGLGSLAGMGLGALLAAPTGGMSLAAGAMLGGSAGGIGGSLFDQ